MLEALHDSAPKPFAETSAQANRLKQAFSEAVDDLCDKWIDAVKHGRRAVSDLAEDCDYAVKKRPLASVAGGAVAGLLLGAVIGWAIGRRL